MNYIILAAGIGSRLHPFSKNIPKCMFQIGHGETVIQRIVRLIKKYDSSFAITIVTGFKRLELENSLDGCLFVNNPFYSVTNSIASLWFARNALNDDTMIINGDIVISEQLFKSILELPKKDMVLLDSSIKKDGDYNVQVNDGYVVVMSKKLDNYYGEYAGITRLTKASSLLLKDEICRKVEEGSFNEWYENALVQLILNSEFRLYYHDISEHDWTEIDSVDHLLLARKIQDKDWQGA
jgi:L-glutamine-phosphate cytidylyltransferase